MESVTIVTEPLLHRDFVQFEIVVPILERLSRKYHVTLAAPRIAPDVQDELEGRNIHAADGGAFFPPIRRSRDEIPSYVGSWMRDAIWGMNGTDIERALDGIGGIRINVSMTTAIDADVWLIQSRPLGVALEGMRRGVNLPLRVALLGAHPFVSRLDIRHLRDAGRRARELYATTQHVADWFATKGLKVNHVLPMYYRPTIRRSSSDPARDYILVYVGKETDSTALRMLLETGLPVTMFGSKSVGWVAKTLRLDRYPRARLLGHVTDEELSDLYSNARFTAFPFTEEPFGLVPLESMACGTPVLTYGQQGPGESVLDGRTGWLVRSPAEFVKRALELWNAGTPSPLMVQQCLLRANDYHLDTVRSGWDHLIETALDRARVESPMRRPRSRAGPNPSRAVGVVPSVRSFAIASGRYRPITKPDLHLLDSPSPRAKPGLAPDLSGTPLPVYRSGNLDEDSSSHRTGSTPEDDLSEEPLVHSRGPESSLGSGGLRTREVSRPAVSEGTQPSTS